MQLLISREMCPYPWCVDKHTNIYGLRILDLCKQCSFCIINGHIGKDKGVGNYTCHTSHGSSLFDYVICNEEFFLQISEFCISDSVQLLADHSMLI